MWFSLLGAGIQCLWAGLWDGWKVSNKTLTPYDGSISVVVCCHDEERQIENFARLLAPSLQAAEDAGCSVEVVAVNHGSVDRTGRILDALAQIDRRWRVVHLKRTRESKKEALEAGISVCRGEVLVLLDADCQPMQSSWLLDLTAGAKANWDIQVGISLPQPSRSFSLLSRMQRLEARRLAQRAIGAVDAGHPYLAFGRNLALTRDIWNRTGGFESHATAPSGDDDLWLQQAIQKGARVKATAAHSAQTSSIWPSTWQTWQRQKSRHFTASPFYPWPLKIRLLTPGMGWLFLAAGVVHNPSGTSISLAGFSVLIRTLTFGTFLRRAGLPRREAWELLLEPVVSAFRVWAWCKGSTSESTLWK